MKKTMMYLHRKKKMKHKITMLTCYDYPTARLQDEAGVDVIFVGDSLGPNELGYAHETEVSMDDMIHHVKAVRRGVRDAYLLADLPYGTYECSASALAHAQTLISHGADGVKLEGMQGEVIARLTQHGIEVWAHLGFNPQHHDKAAVQGKSFHTAKALVEGGRSLASAGACMLVLELIPEELGKLMTEQLAIPTIGVGAGRFTDGQVLIVHDVLGLTPHKLRHAKDYGQLDRHMLKAFQDYIYEVNHGVFPENQHVRHMNEDELQKLLRHFIS